MNVINKSLLALVIGAVCAPAAFAGLQGADKQAADAYFSAHPEIAKYAPWIVANTYEAKDLTQANYQLTGNHPWNPVTGSHMDLGSISPITTVQDDAPDSVVPSADELNHHIEVLKSAFPGWTDDNYKAAALASFGSTWTIGNGTNNGSQNFADLEAAYNNTHPQARNNAPEVISEPVEKSITTGGVIDPLSAQQKEAIAHIDRYSMRPVHNPDSLEHIAELAHNSLMSGTDAGQRASRIMETIAAKQLQDERHASQQPEVQDDAPAAIASATPSQADLKARFDALKGSSLTQANVDRTASQKTALNAARLTHFKELAASQGESKAEANRERTSSQYANPVVVQARLTEQEQADRDSAQDVAIQDAHQAANWAGQKADDAHHAILVNQVDIDNNTANIKTNSDAIQANAATIKTTSDKVDANSASIATNAQNIQTVTDSAHHATVNADAALKESFANGYAIQGNSKLIAQMDNPRYQGMIAAKHNAEQTAIQKQIADVAAASPVDNSTDIKTNAKAIAANKTAIHKQEVTSAHYGAQIQTLATNQNTQQGEIILNHSAVRSVQSQADNNSQQINKLNSNFSNLKSEVNDNKKQASAGISGAMAQSNIPQVLNGQTFAVGAGVGGYDGENAVAVGVSFRASQNVTVKATVSDDTEQNLGYGAGVSVGW